MPDLNSFRLTLDLDADALLNLCGAGNAHLKRIETAMDVRILGHAGDWHIEGEQADTAADVLEQLADRSRHHLLEPADIETVLRATRKLPEREPEPQEQAITLMAGRRQVQGKSRNQRRYLRLLQEHTLTLSVGPAGCGKTYLAVAAAVVALTSHEVERIILTRPAVEAGERLGFLPGDLQQKVDPYLRPLFDALADMLGLEKMNSLMEQGRIEIAPLAYMRGRTLNDAFIILDEAQNTTRAQMKMFLTRLGFASKMVVTGDITQIDLPSHQYSGLQHALHVLGDIRDIGVCRLNSQDVVRHQLVEQIVQAYDREDHD